MGALIESPAFYPNLAGTRNLLVNATLGGLDPARIPALLERVDLAERADDPYRTYSLGMKERLAIAAALLGEPALLILDEPTNGLDPAGIRDMRPGPLASRRRADRRDLLSHAQRSAASLRLARDDQGRAQRVSGSTAQLLASGGDELCSAASTLSTCRG